MSSATTTFRSVDRPITAWLPLATLPFAVFIVSGDWPAWVVMWALALAVYASLKWLTFALHTTPQRPSVWRSAAYLLLWPGMDAVHFLSTENVAPRPLAREWLWA
ncbi:MAG: hypothetical protein KDA41_21375, partial [Planctomycetales bacterium]|nr:hypothetical protein [Planctomycetales bacterium]